jgi:hypothetical protein
MPQPVRVDAAFSTDPLNQRGCSLGTLIVVDLPAHNAPAPDVHDQVETKKAPANHGREVCDVPALDLIRSHRTMDGARPRHVSAKHRPPPRAQSDAAFEAVVLRENSGRDRFQPLLVVQATEKRARHHTLSTRYSVPGQRCSAGRLVRKARAQGRMWSFTVIVGNPLG